MAVTCHSAHAQGTRKRQRRQPTEGEEEIDGERRQSTEGEEGEGERRPLKLARAPQETLRTGKVHSYYYTYTVLPHCYAPPPFLRPTSRKKRGRGHNNEVLRFRLAVKSPPPPPNSRTEINELLATYILSFYIACSLAARLLPPAATAG